MKKTLTIFCCCLLFVLLVAGAAAADERLTKPTDEQKRQIQEAMDQSDGPAANADRCREREAYWRDSWLPGYADYWAAQAEHWESIETDIRTNVIEMVDDYYDIEEPPNTSVSYDPNSTDYGYTYGTKTDIHVVLCPDAFKDGPGLVASTKIHELRHAWQIHICWSDMPGFWTDCTWWFHFTEWDAYDEEERAYDSCFTSDMDPKEKDLIRRRMRQHLRAMATVTHAEWLENLVRLFPDTIFEAPLMLYNPNEIPDVVTVEITNELGWLTTPPMMTIPLDPEGLQLVPVAVTVPPGTPPGTVNAVSLSALSAIDPTDPVEDKCYFVVMPTVDVQAGEPVMTWPDTAVPVQFHVVNNGMAADDFFCELSSTLGWAVTPGSLTLPVNPGESAVVLADVLVPFEAPDWAVDAVFCTATSVADPLQTDRGWVPLQVMEYDAAALGTDNPLGVYPPGEIVMPTVHVINNGHIDSFFDIMFEVERMDGTPYWGEVMTGPVLAPGESTEVVFSPLELFEAGDFTTIVTVLLPEDANPDNDVAFGSFSVSSPGTVGCSISLVPPAGVVPFTTQIAVNLDNFYIGQIRRMAAHLAVTLANGAYFPNWRAGYTNIPAGEGYFIAWILGVPALGTLIGDNLIVLDVEDVTPAPYNQPPYPPAGDTCSSQQILTASAP